jgi:Flp pilus assembly protein TadD
MVVERTRERAMSRTRRTLTTLTSALVLFGGATMARAAGGDPLPAPTSKRTPAAAEAVYNRGLALAGAGDFAAAERQYREAIGLNPRLAEAWNGLGHSLKKQKRFDESLAAYGEALRLRPDFPLAMQYLGELYVDMGRMAEARELLVKLRPLDEQNADKLAEAIFVGSAKW